MGQQLRIVRRNFNGGEVGPQLHLRSDLEPYKKSCITVKNFLTTPYGTAVRRFGTVMSRYSLGSAGREFPFQYSDQVSYRVLVIPGGVVRVFNIGGAVHSSGVSCVSVFDSGVSAVHNYTEDKLPGIFCFQSGDVLFLFHPDHPVLRIERHADDDWKIREHIFTGGPMLQMSPAGELVTENTGYTVTAVEYIDDVQVGYEIVSGTPGPLYFNPGEAVTGELVVELFTYSSKLRITIGQHGIIQGETVVFSGIENEDHDWNGPHTVTGAGASWIEIATDEQRVEQVEHYPEVYELQEGENEEDWIWVLVQEYQEISRETISGFYDRYDLTDIPGLNSSVVKTTIISAQSEGSVSLNIRPKEHGKDGPYTIGDTVFPEVTATIDITAAARVFWKEDVYEPNSKKNVYYYLKLTVASGHGVSSGDSCYVYGLGSPFNGAQSVLKAESTAIYIDSRVRDQFYYSGTGWYLRRRYYNGVEVWDDPGGAAPTVPELPTVSAESKLQKSSWAYNDLFRCISAAATDEDALPAAGVNENSFWRRVTAVTGHALAIATSGVFTVSDIGRKVRAGRKPPTSKGVFTAAGSESVPVPCPGEITLTTREGAWTGTLGLYESTDAGETWTRRGQIEAQNADYNGTITRSASGLNSIWKVVMDSYTSGSGYKCCWVLEPVSSSSDVYGTISNVVSPVSAIITLDNPMVDSITTTDWSLGASGGDLGFPAFGFIQDERLVIGGIPGSPGMVYCSMTNDWTRFDIAQLDTSSFSFMFPSFQAEKLIWGLSKTYMVFGSDSGEWVVKPREAGRGYAFDNIKIEQLSRIGSAPIQPVMHKDTVFFYGTDRKTLWAMAYEYEKDAMYPKQIDILAPHLPESNAVMLCATGTPWPVIWTIDENGSLYSLLYDQTNNVVAWSHHVFSTGYLGMMGSIKSVVSVRKNGISILGLLFYNGSILQNRLHEMPLEGPDVFYKDYYYGGTAQPLTSEIDAELEPTLLTQNDDEINGGSNFSASALDLFVINSSAAGIWISGMSTESWQSAVFPSANYTGRLRVRIESHITPDFRLKIKAGNDNGPFELAGFAVNMQRTNSEII